MRIALLEAVELIRDMNENNRRKLPDVAPLEFIPRKLRPLVEMDGKVEKSAWECALLTAVRDEIKSGNLAVKMSKRFGHFDDFFIPEEKWREMREPFFQRAGLPSAPSLVGPYLKERLNKAFDFFLESLPNNTYASIDQDGWHLSADSSDKLAPEAERRLEALHEWLSKHMREVRLPELLIEVDNDLKITRFFMPAAQAQNPQVDDIRDVLATFMAHGCNIGAYTASMLIKGVSSRSKETHAVA